MLYASDYNTYTKSVGLDNISTGDQRAEQQWFVDAINASGGVLGRRIRPVFHEIRSSDSAEQVGSGACARFTQDQRVTAVAGGGGNQQLRACLQKAGIPHVGGGAAASRLTSAELRRHPLLVDVGGVSVDRLAAAMPEGLRRGGFPQANGAVPVKVGIVTYDAPAYRAAGDQLAAAFRRRGLSVAEVQFVRQDQDNSDLGVIANQMSGAVLRMRSDNVTHMTFLEDHAVIGGLFMIQAENQNYRPYYGLSSGTLPQVLVGTAPDAQLARSVGFGWFPAADVAAPAQAKTPGYDRCLKILADKGDRPSTANALGAALLLCDNIFAAAELLTSGGRADAQGFAAALRKGVTFPSATTFRSQLSTARQDGPSSYRPLAYRADCRCFAYSGQPVAF